MRIDIINMQKFDENNRAIDIALPVLAIECEATPPLENFLDAYEEAVLKLISLGLSTNGIAKALNANVSLVDRILVQLSLKKYVEKIKGHPWELTEDGQDYLNGTIKERPSDEAQYGFMFVNAIKKEVFPYFYKGNLGKIPLFNGSPLPLKLTIEGDEDKTFTQFKIKNSKLRRAYKLYFKNLDTLKNYNDGEISKEEAEETMDLFPDLESFDEEIDEGDERKSSEEKETAGDLQNNMFIRALDKEPTKLYLRMRIIIDPTKPGGYIAESPFDFRMIDNNFFLRQIQWLEHSDNVYLDGERLRDVLEQQICKLSPAYKTSDKSFSVFVIEKIPLLKIYHKRFPDLYDDMERIYELMQRQNSLLEKENIVKSIASHIVECLFNTFFRSISREKLYSIQQKALDDVNTYGYVPYKKQISRNVHLDENTLQWIDSGYLKAIIRKMCNTHGNSIVEKLINMLIIEYHLGNVQIRRFLSQSEINREYKLINKLNRIRRKVSHETDHKFTSEDYEFYMANVFELINNLLEAFRED